MGKVTPITEAPPQPARTLTAEELAARQALRQPKIDRYGELDRRHWLGQPDRDEAAVLKDEIQSWHKDDASDQVLTETGDLYQIRLSPKRTERTIFNKRLLFNLLKKILGIRGLVAVIEIPLGAAVDKNFSKSEQAAFVSEERSGYRTFTVVPLHAAKDPDLPEAA